MCACRKDLAHFGCVCALFVFVCAFRKDFAHFEFVCALFVFVCAFRKDLAHFGFVCALFLFVCTFRKDLAHFGTLGLRQASSDSVKLDKSVSDYSVLGQAFLQNLFSVLERSFLQKTIVLGFICHISLIIIELG